MFKQIFILVFYHLLFQRRKWGKRCWLGSLIYDLNLKNYFSKKGLVRTRLYGGFLQFHGQPTGTEVSAQHSSPLWERVSCNWWERGSHRSVEWAAQRSPRGGSSAGCPPLLPPPPAFPLYKEMEEIDGICSQVHRKGGWKIRVLAEKNWTKSKD